MKNMQFSVNKSAVSEMVQDKTKVTAINPLVHEHDLFHNLPSE